jgi:predicted dehydrogenase
MLKTFVPERPAPGGGGGVLPVEVDDAALTLVRFEGGAVGSIEATRFAAGRRNYNRFEINGSRGSIAFNLERMNELELYTEEGPESGFRTILATDPSHPYMEGWWPPGHIIGYEHTFTHTVLDLLRAVAERRQPKPDFEDGVRAQKILDAVERASLSRTWESV